MPLSSRRPYLLRALHAWMLDNHQTPHILVDATIDGVVVPNEYVRDDRIVLNISDRATSGLRIENERVSFTTRFSGVSFEVRLPVGAVLGIFARESREGMFFGDAERPSDPSGDDPPPGRPQLKVVK